MNVKNNTFGLKLIFVISILIAFLMSNSLFAQQSEVPPSPPTPAPANPSQPAQQLSYAQQASIYSDPFMPGWKSSLSKHSFGVGYSAFSSQTVLVYESDPNAAKSTSYFFGFNKEADTYSESSVTIVAAVVTAPNNNVNTTTRTGVRKPMVLSLGYGSNTLIYKGPFIRTRYGWYGGVDYKMPVSYGTGNAVATDPGTGTVGMQENNLGNVDIAYSPVLRIGPTFDAFLFLRWFPNLAVGFLSGIFYSTDSTVTTTTSTATKTYNIINGNKQTPSAHSTSKTVDSSQAGAGISTFDFGGTAFSLYTNFVIRYEW